MTIENDVNPHAVLAALGVPAVDRITPVHGGRDTALYRVERGNAAYTLRVFRPGELPTCHREVVAMELAANGGIPVPYVHARGLLRERPALLLSWCEGTTVFEALLTRPELATALGVVSGRMLAAIHAIQAPEQQRDRSWLDWAQLGETPLRTLLNAVSRHDRLLHLDFHPLNLLTDGVQITAVLDWANARAGDPRADLARSLTIAQLDTDELPPEAQRFVADYAAALLRGYSEAAGAPTDMSLFHAWAGHVMLRDLAPRLADNPSKRERIATWTAAWERGAGLHHDE